MIDDRLTLRIVVGVFLAAAMAAVVSIPAATAIVVLLLLTALATARPRGALVVSGIVISLVPIYWMPDLPGTRVSLAPAALCSIALLPLAMRARPLFKMLPVDRLVAIFVAVASVSYVVNTKGSIGSIMSLLVGLAFPYATFRLVSLQGDRATPFAAGLVAGGVVSALISMREYNGIANPFFRYFRNGHQHSFFARSDTRLGHFRPEAAFGHAIALGMFLVVAIVLALGLAWRRDRSPGASRVWLYGAIGVMVLALVSTLVRGPLVMVAFAVALLVARESRRGRPSRALFVAAGLALLVNTAAFANVAQLRDATFDTGGRVQQSGEYRLTIWRVVSDPANFSFVGKTVVDEDGVGFTKAAGAQVGIKSFDNAFALFYIGHGVLALIAFVLIGLQIARAALFLRLPMVEQAFAAVLLASFLNLITVNLLTQFAHIFWIGIALVMSAVQRASAPVSDDATEAAPVAAS